MTTPDLIAVIVVRDGVLPAGADEAVAEAGGAAVVAGTGSEEAAHSLESARTATAVETAPGTPGRLAAGLRPLLGGAAVVILPASPDGRDLAPLLAVELERPLFAWAVRCSPSDIELARFDHRVSIRVGLDGPAVATLAPGARGSEPVGGPPAVRARSIGPPGEDTGPEAGETLPADPATMDLGEARRILGGGAGLVPPEESGTQMMRLLGAVARALGASAGATRVVTDAGWMDYSRQIGTTGVVVDPDLYISFGVSGAAQHTGGLGAPDHVISVNTDPSCPMTAMADLGIVADAPAVLRELARRLGAGSEGERRTVPSTKGEHHGA